MHQPSHSISPSAPCVSSFFFWFNPCTFVYQNGVELDYSKNGRKPPEPPYAVLIPLISPYHLMVEAMVSSRFSHGRTALDLGTGCGVVALLLSVGPKPPAIVASDVSVNAVYGAKEEMKRQGLQVEVIQARELGP